METLPEHAPESAPAGVGAIPAIAFSGSFGKELRGNPTAQGIFQLVQGVGKDLATGAGGAGTQGSQKRTPGGEERSFIHRAVYIPPLLTGLLLFSLWDRQKRAL